ncbi:arylesterase [Sandarakinorhabdus sp.]|jgi:acyl-CoA thioesterase-1|uniref:arylesterase n=1 Tax=Sandarakinorhabdus sp. TaxID=1916663 RepID=UPI0028AFF0D9|nr:arylesterase [Sandarakinorhabdus sp.]
MALLFGALFMSQAVLARPLVVLAYGDSLTAGYQLPPGQGFAPQLEKALKAKGRDVTVVGAGVSGDTSTQGRARVNWVLAGMKQKPDLVVLELGANDMLRGQPPKTARANLDAMVKAFKAKGARVLVAGMRANPTLGKAYVTEFETMFPAVAKANGVSLYPFFLDGVAAQPGLQLADGMHPNGKGVQVMVKRILPAVERELALIK